MSVVEIPTQHGAKEEGGDLQYDEASDLYYDSSFSPIKYYHWNPNEQSHMLVIIPDELIDEWGYFQEEVTVHVDVDVLVQQSKKKKKMSSKRKKLKEEKFLAKKARAEADPPADSLPGTANAPVQVVLQDPAQAQTSLPSPSLDSSQKHSNGSSSRRAAQQIYQPPHARLTAQQAEQTQAPAQQYTQAGAQQYTPSDTFNYPQPYTDSQIVNQQMYTVPQAYGSYPSASSYNVSSYTNPLYNAAPISQALPSTSILPSTPILPSLSSPLGPSSVTLPSNLPSSSLTSPLPSSTFPSSSVPPATSPTTESDDMDLQPRSYREYAEANYNEYTFPGNDSSSIYFPKQDNIVEYDEPDEEEPKPKKKKKKKKEKADEPIMYDYTYYAKLFSKHVQADYKVGDEGTSFSFPDTGIPNIYLETPTSPPSPSLDTKDKASAATNSEAAINSATNSTSFATNPTNTAPTTINYATNSSASTDFVNPTLDSSNLISSPITNPGNPPTNPAQSTTTTFDFSSLPPDMQQYYITQFNYHSLTPEQQQYMLYYYFLYQQPSANPSTTPQTTTSQTTTSQTTTSQTTTLPPATSPLPSTTTSQESAQSNSEATPAPAGQPTNPGTEGAKSENAENTSTPDPTNELLAMEFDPTSQMYYLRNKGWYYDPNTALYMDMNDFPASLYHWNNAVGDWWKVSATDVHQKKKEEMPPCIQLVVTNPDVTLLVGNIPQVKDGSDEETEETGKIVFSIGRSANSKLCIPHEESSYHHAQIVYQSIFFENVYWLRDVGSKNGTFLNGERLSEPRVASGKEEHRLKMGDTITIGPTTIKVEEAPWSVLRDITATKKKERKNDVLPSRKGFGRVTNAQLRAAFNALDDDERQQRARLQTAYRDRAALRRATFGVDPTPGQRQDGEGEELLPYVPVQGHITAKGEDVTQGRGAKLMRAMGWADGQRLGKNETGLAAPIEAGINSGRAGLGFGDSEQTPAYVANPTLSYAENGRRAIYARYGQGNPQ